MIELETERLSLRQLHESDFEAFAAMNADPEGMRHIGEGKPLDREPAWRKLAQLIGHWRLRGYGLWAAEENATGAFVGTIGLWFPEGWPGLEVGWHLARAHWGKGFATEGAIAARDHAFGDLKLDKLISLIRPDNTRSIAVAERLGETLDRRIDELNGGPALVYSVTRAQVRGD